jgi:hypothetical protein
MRPVLVGIAPSRPGAEGQPLTSLGGASTGATLAGLAGLSNMDYLRRFDRVNLCPSVQPSTIPLRLGRDNAMNLAGSLLRGRRVVLLGANVLACFGLGKEFGSSNQGFGTLAHMTPNVPYMAWFPENGRPATGYAGFKLGMSLPFHWAVLPHPSGRNRWYNDPANREAARAFMTELAEGWEGAD